MPSTYAHKHFGDKILRRDPPALKGLTPAQKELFFIGLHGPDILFYYKALTVNRVNAVGFGQHEKPAADFFGPAAALVRTMPVEDRGLSRAYLMGFLCHFALDSACHGYIEQKIHVSGVTHTEIEGEFDRSLMAEQGLDPVRQDLTGHIHPTAEHSRVIAPFFPTVTPKEVEKSLRSMIFYNRLLVAPGFWKRSLVKGALRLSGNYTEMHGLLINSQPDPRCADSCVRLKKLMDRAEEQCLALMEGYLPCLAEERPLPVGLEPTFGPGANWQKIPVLSLEKELVYEV